MKQLNKAAGLLKAIGWALILVAESLRSYLARHPEMERRLTKGGSAHFLTTEQAEAFRSKATVFMGQQIEAERVFLE